MLEQQILTNRKQKASSAATPKASHLTVITDSGIRPMNNSTATDFNSQINQAYNTASEALDCVTLAMEHIGGLEALFKSIYLQSKNKHELKEILNASKLGCYVCDDFINSLDCQKEGLEKHLKVLGGASHE